MSFNIQTLIYNNSPAYIQNILCSFQGKKLLRDRFNDKFEEYLDNLNKTNHFSFEQINQYKEEQLYRILEYSYNNVPFYKDSFKKLKLTPYDFKGINDIRKFPILTKEDIRENYNKMVSICFDKRNLIANHTSGSSGKALDFYQTKDSLPYIWAIWWRFRNRFGVKFGDKHLNCTGKLVVPIGMKNPPYWRINRPMNQWLLNMQHLSLDKIEAIASMINKESFIYFSGYPSIIYALASLIVEKGLKIYNPPQFIFTGAEKMYDNQKEVIEIAFPGVVITDHYGTSEGVINASKCCHGVYHEDFELGHLECENPHYISENMYEGDILGTCFHNYGMPFIRYKIGDSAVWSTEECSCGLSSQVIKDIQGRSEDYVITPEGLQLKRFDYLFKNTIGIKECQVLQRELGHVVFRIVCRDNYNSRTEKEIINGVKEIISPTIKCHFEYVKEIERTAAGKFKAVVSELKK